MSIAFKRRALLAYTLLLMLGSVAVASIAALDQRPRSAEASVLFLLCLAWVSWHSVIVRGLRLTAQFVLLAAAIAFGVEALTLNVTEALYHNLHPQVLEVPLQIVGGWVVCLYAGFAVTLSLVSPTRSWRGAFPFCVIAALAATALDLTADPLGVRLGAFAYQQGGAFMPEIEGSNGAHGIPLVNYLGWMLVATGTYVIFWLSGRSTGAETERGRVEALLFYVSVFCATAIPALRLGYAQLLLIGGLPVTLVSVLVTYRLIADRQTRELGMRRSRQRARVTNLADRRFAMHRR